MRGLPSASLRTRFPEPSLLLLHPTICVQIVRMRGVEPPRFLRAQPPQGCVYTISPHPRVYYSTKTKAKLKGIMDDLDLVCLGEDVALQLYNALLKVPSSRVPDPISHRVLVVDLHPS